MSQQEKARRMKITLTVWAALLIPTNAAALLGIDVNPALAWGGLIVVIVGTFYYQFVQGREFPDE